MPLDMPESVLVRFKGRMQPGVTLRDLVHAIPYAAIKAGLLTVAKAGKKNIFSGRILEIEGLPQLKVEQAFELSDASAERSAAGCTIKLNKAPVIEYLSSNIVLMKNMIADGYADKRTLERRIRSVQAWLANPQLLEADKDAEYAAVIEIDLNELKEPVLCCPNDPDDAKLLSEVASISIPANKPLAVNAATANQAKPGQAVFRNSRNRYGASTANAAASEKALSIHPTAQPPNTKTSPSNGQNSAATAQPGWRMFQRGNSQFPPNQSA
jgi:hypothetical protein